MNRFSKFSTDELLAEIARRRNISVSLRPILKCEYCKHFKPSEKPDDTYNPCAMGRKMEFRMPEGPTDRDGDWGFYLRCCPDRVSIAEL
ncbi:MAG: hypothetical protein FD135_2352 [Comamonadaceae bacterium]|nr:MAG: hypothetical protein FD135_2352 [Comamonadaceae bacterium]